MANNGEDLLLANCVEVKDALAAIRSHAEIRMLKHSQDAIKNLEDIKQRKEEILQKIKNMQLEKAGEVPVESFESFLSYEKELYNIHARSLEKAVNKMIKDLETMVNHSLKFYKTKFYDPKLERMQVRQSGSSKVKLIITLMLYAFLFVIPFVVYYALQRNMPV